MATVSTTSAGGIVLNPYGEILLVEQKGRAWGFPKGHVEAHEDTIAAAKREIAEEAGIDLLRYIRHLGTYERYRIGLDGRDDHSEHKTITLLLFLSEQMELAPRDSDNTDARWFARGEVAQKLTHYRDREFFEKVLPQI